MIIDVVDYVKLYRGPCGVQLDIPNMSQTAPPTCLLFVLHYEDGSALQHRRHRTARTDSKSRMHPLTTQITQSR
jgi:hypothetical protein